jgi:hypothetical protein
MAELASDDRNKVHDVLLALQKSLSRVSRDSVSNSENANRAMALITGDVKFSFTLKCDLQDKDNLVLQKEGPIELHLDGIVTTDLDVQDITQKSEDIDSASKSDVFASKSVLDELLVELGTDEESAVEVIKELIRQREEKKSKLPDIE